MNSSKPVRPKPDKSLIVKLAEACAAVGGQSKDGRNEVGHYNWLSYAKVAGALRKELFSRNVIVLADEKEVIEKDVTLPLGTLHQVTLRTEFQIIDGDSDASITRTAFGMAMDDGDKALYKAKTGALKYFLRGLGLIPDEADDPEADTTVDEMTDSRVYDYGETQSEADSKASRAAKRKRDKIRDVQVRAFDSACHKSGRTAEQVAVYLRSQCNVPSVADLTKEHFDAAIKWALGAEPIAETLAASVLATQQKKVNGSEPIEAAKAVNA